ncbi:MAG: y4mF family transcriptional regulator [Crocinitomicaceae bacterium]|jgi:y4mF family transcriptional regulator
MLITELGNSIKARRKTLGITQVHLADLAGVNSNTIIRIENGKINPSIEIINSIVDVLGMEITLSIKKHNT